MTPTFSRHLEKTMVLVLVVTFALPLLLGRLLILPDTHGRITFWLRNRPLAGQQVPLEPVAFSVPNVLSAKYQEGFAKHYDVNYCGRERMIRRHYDAVSADIEPTEYFGIMPHEAAKIIPLPAQGA